MSDIAFQNYPIGQIIPAVRERLASPGNLVVTAPTGSGKSTLLPLALLDQPWLQGRKILMLEPRRLAARACARRMAQLLGEEVGVTVGYQVRFERKISPQTRLEVLTEGILTRRLQQSDALDDVGLVIFDEFHERNLNSDLGLALCLDLQRGLYESVRLLVMSATLDTGPLCRMLDGATVLQAEGRSYPVEVSYLRQGVPEWDPARIEGGIKRACHHSAGDILVFLPGVGEIRNLQRRLDEAKESLPNLLITPLYGDLGNQAQDLALQPDPAGRRRVILATAIAETSLTIEGVGCVVDCGLQRLQSFHPGSGLGRLETKPVSQAAAEQRRGRAGRLGPGLCYRLWSEQAQGQLPAHNPPEILVADLAPLVLELALWGVSDPAQLEWLDAPPPGHWAQAVDLLRRLGLLDGQGRATSRGREVARLGVHPRLGNLLLEARARGQQQLGCDLAAILTERDPLRSGSREPCGADIELRLHALEHWRSGHGRENSVGAWGKIDRASRQWRRVLGKGQPGGRGRLSPGALLSLAYPDRVAGCRGGDGLGYQLASGRGARLYQADNLAASPFLVMAQLDAGQREGRVLLAATISKEEILQLHAGQLRWIEQVQWDARTQAVSSRRERRMGALAIERENWRDADDEAVRQAMLDGIRQLGLQCLPWSRESKELLGRLGCLRRWQPQEGWPDTSEEGLLNSLEEWLGPWLQGTTRRSQLAEINLRQVLESWLEWDRLQRVKRLAPTHIEVPSGSRVRLQYPQDGETAPVLAVRLQELFGLLETPRVCAGQIGVLIHLLSPAQRPIQITSDLASFWRNTYPEVRKELKGRYPKHYWPEDPFSATATRRVRPQNG